MPFCKDFGWETGTSSVHEGSTIFYGWWYTMDCQWEAGLRRWECQMRNQDTSRVFEMHSWDIDPLLWSCNFAHVVLRGICRIHPKRVVWNLGRISCLHFVGCFQALGYMCYMMQILLILFFYIQRESSALENVDGTPISVLLEIPFRERHKDLWYSSQSYSWVHMERRM